MTKSTRLKEYTFRSAYETDDAIKKYGCSSLSLFVLNLFLEIDDIDEFASNNITDAIGDKKIDVCYLNEETHSLYIIQNYISATWYKASAPEKSNDLNTALSWLFFSDINSLPVTIKAKAIEAREALQHDEIKDIHLLYIHNCLESDNNKNELKTVANSLIYSLKGLLKTDDLKINILPREIGVNTIESYFLSIDNQILINKTLDVPITSNYLEENTSDWKSVLTTVRANWIGDLYIEYKNDLFSANYRDFLGYSKDTETINNKIIETANSEPENFWVFNNGITALTNEIKFSKGNKKIRGISIINGAQTSGALGSATDSSLAKAKVIIRFVECKNPELIDHIIEYNNTQNDIKPEDLRSKDDIQKELHSQFNKYNIVYRFRRSDKRKSKSHITGKSIASILCAFHGDPQTAYRNATKIYKDDMTYNSVFRPSISAEHIFLVRALSSAFDMLKSDLKKRVAEEKATEEEVKQYRLLRFTSSKYFMIFLVGFLFEEILGTRISEKYFCKCTTNVISITNKSLVTSWRKTLQAIIPFIVSKIESKCDESFDAFFETPRSDKLTKDFALEFKPLMVALKPQLSTAFSELRKRVTT